MKDPDALSWFSVLAEERSVTNAAKRLYLTQQTLSARLSSLEADLGCKLFERTSPLRLTRAGAEFLAYEQESARLRDDFQRRLDDINEGTGSVLRIAVALTRGRILLPAALELFFQRHPRAKVQVVSTTNDQLLDLLYAGEVDVCIARFPEHHPGLEVAPLMMEEMVLVLPRAEYDKLGRAGQARLAQGHLDCLVDVPFLMYPEGDISQRVGSAYLAKGGVKPKVRMVCENAEIVVDACSRGMGAAFCPRNVLDACLPCQEAIKVVKLGEQANYQVGIGVVSQAGAWKALDDFIACLVDSAS